MVNHTDPSRAADEDFGAAWKEETAESFGEDVIAKVKAEHSGAELRQFSTPDGAVICRAPSRGEFKRFRTMYLDAQQRPGALEALLYGCVVHPDRKVLGELLERRPGLAETFGSELAAWAGLGEEVVQKKL